MCVALAKPLPADVPKKLLPMWSPATFQGDVRGAGVEQVACLVFDVDETPVPTLEEISRALEGARWFAHSSSSATFAAPRWRLVVEIPRPVTREEHAKVWLSLTKKLPFPVGAQSKDASRAWYLPRFGSDGFFVTSAAPERTA